MAKPLPTGSEQPAEKPPVELNRRASDRACEAEGSLERGRRASDRQKADDSLREHGRRASDGVYIAPKNRKMNVAIWCSFIFSTGLILWSFSRPFLGYGVSGTAGSVPEAELAKMELHARMSSEDYVSYTQQMERDLQEEFQRVQSRPKPPAKTKEEISEQWNRRIEKVKSSLEKMREENEGKPFLKGTIEWELEQELEKMREDSPPPAK